MESPDAIVIRRVKTEMSSHFPQIIVLGGEDATVRESDMEQAAEKVLEHRSVPREQAPDLAGVALEPGGALTSEIKDQPDMLLFTGRDLEHFAESGDLVAGDNTVGPRHLGAKRDHRDGEGDAAARVVITAFSVTMRVPARNVARRAGEQRTE